MKRFRPLIALLLVLSMVVPTFALTPSAQATTLPPWVEEGELWFPSDGIMLAEDFGNCPKGHTGPAGYHYEGYTMGRATGHFDALSDILTIVSKASGNSIVVRLTATLAEIFRIADKNEDPDLTYFKYVYTKGSSTYYHIVYATKTNPGYAYLTCETGYEL